MKKKEKKKYKCNKFIITLIMQRVIQNIIQRYLFFYTQIFPLQNKLVPMYQSFPSPISLQIFFKFKFSLVFVTFLLSLFVELTTDSLKKYCLLFFNLQHNAQKGELCSEEKNKITSKSKEWLKLITSGYHEKILITGITHFKLYGTYSFRPNFF